MVTAYEEEVREHERQMETMRLANMQLLNASIVEEPTGLVSETNQGNPRKQCLGVGIHVRDASEPAEQLGARVHQEDPRFRRQVLDVKRKGQYRVLMGFEVWRRQGRIIATEEAPIELQYATRIKGDPTHYVSKGWAHMEIRGRANGWSNAPTELRIRTRVAWSWGLSVERWYELNQGPSRGAWTRRHATGLKIPHQGHRAHGTVRPELGRAQQSLTGSETWCPDEQRGLRGKGALSRSKDRLLDVEHAQGAISRSRMGGLDVGTRRGALGCYRVQGGSNTLSAKELGTNRMHGRHPRGMGMPYGRSFGAQGMGILGSTRCCNEVHKGDVSGPRDGSRSGTGRTLVGTTRIWVGESVTDNSSIPSIRRDVGHTRGLGGAPCAPSSTYPLKSLICSLGSDTTKHPKCRNIILEGLVDQTGSKWHETWWGRSLGHKERLGKRWLGKSLTGFGTFP